MSKQKQHTNTPKRTRQRAISFCVCVLTLLLFFPPRRAFALPTGFQEYYVLGYEEHAWRAFLAINDDDPDPIGLLEGKICSTVSLVATADHQKVYYDHWEDGYEADLLNHVQPTTEVYTLNTGDDINLISNQDIVGTDAITGYVSVNPERDPGDLRYDGGDRVITSGGPVNLTHAMWPLDNSWVGGAWEIYSRQAYADAYSYRLPVGEDLYDFGGGDDGNYGDLRNVYLQLEAFEDNTTVSISNATGTINLTLDRGQAYSSMGYINSTSAPTITIKAGTVVRTNKPTQAGLMTGADGTFQGRFLIVLPDQLWGADYVVPVPSGGSGQEAEVYLSNPNDFEISINAYDTETQTTFIVSPTGYISATVPYSLQRNGLGYVPQGSAARFTSSDGVFGIVVAAHTSETSYDWGFSGIPAKYLARDYYASWSPGNSCTPPSNPNCDGDQPAVNGSPVWVTPLADSTTFYVDFGPSDDIVDETFTLDVLEQRRIFDPDKDNTGMHIWATEQFAIAWGEDPSTAGSAVPYLDLGFSMLPPIQRWLEPVLTLDKIAVPTILPPEGGIVTFTLAVQSHEPPLTNVDVSDTLPIHWTYVPDSTYITYPDHSTGNLEPTINGRELYWNTSTDMGLDQDLILSFQAQITNTNGVSISVNQGAAIGTHDYSDALFNPSDDATVYISDLDLIKSVNIAEAEIGSTLVYSLSYKNVSSSTPVTNVVIYDVIPIQHTTFQSASGAYSYSHNSGTVAWTFPSLAPQESGIVSFTAKVNDFVEDGTIIENVGYIDSDQTVKAGSNVVRTAVLVPDIALKKSGPTAARAEHLITYIISYENIGGAQATGVTIQDTIPVSTTYVSASLAINTGTGWVPLIDPRQGAYISPTLIITPGVTPGNIAAGETGQIRFDVQVDSDVELGSRIMNWATLDRDLDIPRDSNLVITRIADLTVGKTADTSVKLINQQPTAVPGSLITYTLTYTNHSNTQPQTNIYLREPIPDYTSFVSASGIVSYSWDHAATWSSTRPTTMPVTHVRWHTDLLPTSTSRTVYLTVRVSDVLPTHTTIQNMAHITSTETADLGEWIPSKQVKVETVDLWVQKDVNQSNAQIGDPISYTISYGNHGSTDALGVQILDTIPAGVTYIPDSIWGTGANDNQNPTLTWDTMTVAVGVNGLSSGYLVTLNGDLLPATAITNTAVLSSAYGLDTSDPVTITVTSSADLVVSKSNDPSIVNGGELLSYTIVVSNVGAGYATDVSISDTLSSSVQFVPNSIALDPPSAGMVGITPPILAHDVLITAGHRVTLTFATTVTAPLVDGAVITNETYVTSPHEPAPATSTATATVQSPVLTLTKQSDPADGSGIIGTPLTYTLIVSNPGHSVATCVVVTDVLPDGANYILGGSFISSSGSVSWTIPTILPDDGQQVTFVVSTCQNSLFNTSYRVVSSAQKIASPFGPPLPLSLTPPSVDAGFDFDPPVITINDTVYFGSTSTSNGSPITEWSWDFGDNHTASGSTANHAYSSPGVYTVTLTITDACGYAGTATETVSVHIPILTIDKSAQVAIAQPGESLTYTIAVSNTGQDHATSVIISDTLSVHTSLLTATMPFTGPVNGIITWPVGTLAPSATHSVTLVVSVNSSPTNSNFITNTAWASSDQGVSSSDTATTLVKLAADLSVTKFDSSDPVRAGTTLTYTLIYTNTGPMDAQSVYITDTLPSSVTFGKIANATPSLFGPTVTLPHLTWYTPSLAVGKQGIIVFTVTVEASASSIFSNNVTISSAIADPIPDNNSSTAATDVTPQVDFDSAAYTVGESDGTATITVTLSHPINFAASVDYQTTSGGSATPGDDYTSTVGVLNFGPLSTVQTFSVPIISDPIGEIDETIVLTLTGATNAIVATAHNPAILTISDDDPPIINFSALTFRVSEGGGSEIISVTLNKPSIFSITVDYSTLSGTATAGKDYTATNGTLNFAPLSITQTFSVSIISDLDTGEGNETVVLSLTKATSATIGNTNPALLWIIDDDCQDDSYEPDDIFEQAHNYVIGTLQQRHNFCTDTSDWVKFTAGVFGSYKITTTSEGDENPHPALAIFDTDGQTMLTSTSAYTGNTNTIVWKAPTSGDYYVHVTNDELSSDVGYGLRIILTTHPSFYLPLVIREL